MEIYRQRDQLKPEIENRLRIRQGFRISQQQKNADEHLTNLKLKKNRNRCENILLLLIKKKSHHS